MPWLAPVTIATEFDISILLHSKAQVSVADHDQLSASLVSLHGAVRLTDLVEAEDTNRLDVEPTGGCVLRDLLQRHVREREARRAEDETAEEGQIDAARHLQQRVEVGDRIEATQPA